MMPISMSFSRPKYSKTIYLDKDGVLNDEIIRNGKLSSPQNISEIVLKKDLSFLSEEIKKKNIM